MITLVSNAIHLILLAKKILFVTGSKGTRIGKKKAYFKDIKLWKKDNSMIATDLILFTEQEKKQYGGFDGMLTYWAKVPPNKKKLFKKKKNTLHY